jgi:hypothetical protein
VFHEMTKSALLEAVESPREIDMDLVNAQQARRVLDRLAGLEQVISGESVQQALLATGRVGQRACQLTHEVTLWIVLAMSVLTDLPIRQVFKHARRLRVGENSPHRSSLCVARKRLGVAPLRELFATTVRPLAQPDTPGAFYRGFRLVAIDGVVYNTPDTKENEKAFGRPSGGDRGLGAFPQLRKVSLVEVGTHVELALILKRIACGETTAMEGLWRHIPTDSLLLEDRGFFSSSSGNGLFPRRSQFLQGSKAI